MEGRINIYFTTQNKLTPNSGDNSIVRLSNLFWSLTLSNNIGGQYLDVVVGWVNDPPGKI